MGSPQALSVTEVVSQIKETLEGDFRHLVVEGEVSNLTYSTVGHWYFTLKDRESALQVALFKGNAMRNPLIRRLKGGEQVICTGSLGVYLKRGTFQIICSSLSLKGKGDLSAQFEALKKKLAAQGLFDLSHKRPLPSLPQKVGVITSKSGAAFQDFINVYRRRSLWMDVTLIPALVQGEGAPSSLIKALNLAVQKGGFDILVLTRGGGSAEDLWAFNHEGLARAIFSCPLPVVSAVGHQVDFTIADYVADVRVETPTAAAELLTQAQSSLMQRLTSVKKMILLYSCQVMAHYRHALLKKSPTTLVQVMKDKLVRCQKQLIRAQRIQYPSSFFRFHEMDLYLDDLISRGRKVVEDQITKDHHRLDHAHHLLQACSVQRVLRRGYSYLSCSSTMVSSHGEFKRLPRGEELKVHFFDGVGVVSSGPPPRESGE